jgi:diketogulonate reductase-like aldo/keto reductase
MEKRPWGWTGTAVPVLGQGTWKMEHDEAASALGALQAGLDAGLTHIDTAELYGSGSVEQLVGRAITGRRREIFLVSKVLPSNASREGTVRACERSLSRLRTDHLDCYLLHWPGNHPLEDTIEAFEQLLKAGKIRSWGVSNFDVPDLEEALRIAGPRRMACNQVLHHLRARDIEARVVPWCIRQEVAVVGYSPFGSGEFPSPQSRGGKVLGEIARAHGVTPHQLALAFLVRDRHLFAIPKSARADRVRENAAAASLRLTEDELKAIDGAFPVRTDRGLPVI